MKIPKIALIWPHFNFYHVTRFRALYEILGNNLLGIELVGGIGDDGVTQWRYLQRDGLPVVTLFPYSNIRDLSPKNLGLGVIKRLEENNVNIVFATGYYSVEHRMVIHWAWRNKKKCFIFFESKYDDFRRFFLKEWFKRWIVKKLDGAICGGKSQRDYLIKLGMPEDRIFFGYDVVNNDYFKGRSQLAKKNEYENRVKYNLPQQYFFTCSRFMKNKNLVMLLEAYKLYRAKTKATRPWALVICGEGPEENKLRNKIRAENIDEVYLCGVKTPEELAVYYGLASCFVLVSLREPWGLVINEAMACSLPILVTKVAGAAYELVEDGVNGYKFNPLNIDELSNLMLKITCLGTKRPAEMGSRSQEKIISYSPKYFAENIIKAIQAV